MARLKRPQKSSSQPMSNPALYCQKLLGCGVPRAEREARCVYRASAPTTWTWGSSPLRAMPSWARASMMRRPAMRSPPLPASAWPIRYSRTGSSKMRHHWRASGSTPARVACCSAGVFQPSAQDACWGWKSGPSFMQPPRHNTPISSSRFVQVRSDIDGYRIDREPNRNGARGARGPGSGAWHFQPGARAGRSKSKEDGSPGLDAAIAWRNANLPIDSRSLFCFPPEGCGQEKT